MLPSSGALSLSDIQTAMGGSNPISLSEYYDGGTYVPSGTPPNTIPTSGAISIGNFRSAGKYKDEGTSGTVQKYYTIPVNEGGVGEGYWRVVGSWTATYGGTVKAQYYTYADGQKSCTMYFQLVRNGSVVSNLQTSSYSSGSAATVSITYDGSVTLLPGDVLRGYCYLWGAYNTDHIGGGYFNVYGTP